MTPEEKIRLELQKVTAGKRMSQTDVDHCTRHMKGVLSGIGELIEDELKKLVR